MDPRFLAYMRACLILCMEAPHRLRELSLSEIQEAFALLPVPAVSFQEWCLRLDLVSPKGGQPSSPMDKESELKSMLSDPMLAGIVSLKSKKEEDG